MTALEITALSGQATLQDGGRFGWMSRGLSPAGPLVPEFAAMANASVGNTWDAPCLEVMGKVSVLSHARTFLADDQGNVVSLHMGESYTLKPSPVCCVRYLATPGGFEVPTVLGSSSLHKQARIGPISGRGILVGDRLGAKSYSSEHGPKPRVSHALMGIVQSIRHDNEQAVRVIQGPDLDRFTQGAFDDLCNRVFVISSRSDRVGYRLDGPKISGPEDLLPSAPMALGAIEIPPGGEPICLGPEHPTTGGYALIGVIASVDRGRFFARKPGHTVRFKKTEAEQARALYTAHKRLVFAS